MKAKELKTGDVVENGGVSFTKVDITACYLDIKEEARDRIWFVGNNNYLYCSDPDGEVRPK